MTTIGVFAGVFDDDGRVLCVRHDYGRRLWGMPGGRLECREDPISAVVRETFEEASGIIEVDHLVGVYSATYKDDVVLLFAARLIEQKSWVPNDEIAEIGYFPLTDLPDPMHPNPKLRFADIATGQRGIVRALSAPGVAIGG